MPVKNAKDKDLFQESTMSFSQHLDELRICLIRAFTFLAVGVCIGFTMGTPAMNFINRPLEKSLEHFYSEQALRKIEADIKELRKTGQADTLIAYIRHGFLPQEFYITQNDRMALLHADTGKPLVNTLNAEGRISIHDVDNLNKSKGVGVEPTRVFLMTKVDDDRRTKLKSLSQQESFTIWIKASFVVGLLISCPFVFWSIWMFIGAGLYPHERRYVYIFLPISVGLFIAGMLLAFFVVFQFVLDFLFFFNRMLNIEPDPRISEWLNFALMLPVGFGISFQLPLVMFFLERIGVFSIKTYLSKWRISSFGIVIISAMLTPGDPYSMLLMSVPLVFLYFCGILMCKLFPRSKSIFDFDEQDLVPVD
ncbi:MAG: twin-arginine translocase subunit TatC [Planctomycetaceae bacterium]|nr:twin-arginine translocase subunit TatC [Planctomycetaceae bacterium]